MGRDVVDRVSKRFVRGAKSGGRRSGRAIRNLYKLGLFSDIKIFIEQVPGGAAVIIDLKAVPRLGTVAFRGNSAVKDKTLKRELGLIENQLIQAWEQKRAVNKLIALYRKKGYLLASVGVRETQVDADGQLPLIFEIDEGEKVNLKKNPLPRQCGTGREATPQADEETKQDGWWFGGGKFNEETYPDDCEKVLAFYRQNGYRDAAIISDSLSYGPNKKDMFLDITIEEGPIYRFGAVTWAGNEKINDAGFCTLSWWIRARCTTRSACKNPESSCTMPIWTSGILARRFFRNKSRWVTGSSTCILTWSKTIRGKFAKF